jgi:PHD/YefM family antitoxin component YafN of YafNO toxin-antitoxin module
MISVRQTEHTAMTTISANDLKTQGVSAIADALEDAPEATVSVRGKERFVVMDLDHYRYLRECELSAALAESQADLAAGRFVKETVDAHMKRLAKLA